MNNFKRKIFILIVVSGTLLTVACDRTNRIAIVKNESKSSIFVIRHSGDIGTDSTVNIYYTTFPENLIMPDSTGSFYLLNRALNKQSDSSRIYLDIFDVDSLVKYQKASHVKGILVHSILKRIEIHLNKVKEPLDTIYLK